MNRKHKRLLVCRHRNAILWACLFAASFSAASSSIAAAPFIQRLPAAKAAKVDAAIQAQMQTDQCVGMAVGIIQNGQIVYLKCFGLADREKNVPVTTDTTFRWASCSKPVAAVLAMQLAEKGQLDLDADVRNYVPEFPDKGVVITSRQLLCHQSGIPHYSNGTIIPTEVKYDSPHPYTDPVVSLDHFNQSPLIFEPGEKHEYSSYAYILLTAVIERAGKQPFAEQMQERIAKRLALTTLQPDYEWVDIANRAIGYEQNDGGIVPSKGGDVSWKWGAGGLISNIGDFAAFANGLLHGRLMIKKTQSEMWTPQKTLDGQDTGFGLGFHVDVNKSGKLVSISHNGSQDKVRTRFIIYPDRKNGIVVMTNSEWVNPRTFTGLIKSELEKK